MKTLIVYYSRTGNTRKVGEEIAKELLCDVEEIVDTADRSGPMGWIKSGRQASMKELTKLQPLKKDISTYDIVIIGTPVWAATISSPIRTFIVENRDKIKKAAFFITLGSKGAEATLKEIEELYGKKPAGTLAVTAAGLKNGSYVDALNKFARELRA